MSSCHGRITLSFLLLGVTALFARAQTASAGNPARGKTLFQQNCALCHADHTAADGSEITGQGPWLVGVVGRPAAANPTFSYTSALRKSGLTWDAATLDRFLKNPGQLVPGTTMPAVVAKAQDRQDIIAYLSTLKMASAPPASPKAPPTSAPVTASASDDPGDWHHAAPGVAHHLTLADLPAPYATHSSGNGPRVVPAPAGAALSVPAGFSVKLFARGFINPRIICVAPNGDIFVAETAANRVRVLRAAEGADSPRQNQIFAEGLDRPFGIAFYPPGKNPQWMYVANNNSVVRIPYHNGDLTAEGKYQIIVPQLTQSHGGHSTRDVAFSRDGKRMFISVGSSSNIADTMEKKSVADAQAWEATHGLGAGWGPEENRADILVTDPEGHTPLHTYATGIRNGVGIAVNPTTGQLWSSTNERDGLGDDLVPDYITHVREGGYYGWPWYYLGNHEEPRHAGERPDLAGKAIVPDVLLQAHSASLEMCFYPVTATGPAAFPADYHGDAFAAFHGSWNRSSRTGYKVVRVRLKNGVATGEYDDFLTGFVVDEHSVWGRPVGVAVARDGALLVGEDGGGTIWRVAPSRH